MFMFSFLAPSGVDYDDMIIDKDVLKDAKEMMKHIKIDKKNMNQVLDKDHLKNKVINLDI